MVSTPQSQTPRRCRSVVGMWAALVLVALLVFVNAAISGPQRAEAQTGVSVGDGVNFGDCSFRKGTGIAETWANQMCWLDVSDLTTPGPKTKKVGDYTITFNLGIETKNTNTRFTANPNPSWNETAFAKTGTGFFERYSSATAKDILQMEGSDSPFARFTLTDISVNRNGVVDPLVNYRFAVVDGESTGAGGTGEMISIDGGVVGQAVRLTPTRARDACSGSRDAQFGPGTEPRNWGTMSDGRNRGFVCFSRTTGTFGTWVVGVDNPTTLQISMGSNNAGTQGVAIGIALSRIAFAKDNAASVQNAFEQLADPTARTASYSAFLQDGDNRTTLSTPSGGSTTVLRRVGSDGVPLDRLGYTSAIQPAAQAFQRYEPVWKCTLTSSSTVSETFTIRNGSVPSGYSLKRDEQAGSSTLLIPARETRIPNCTITWESKYKPAKLDLSKTVDGNAANFTENSLQQYRLHYSCTAPEGFTAAYPGTKLEDEVVVEAGRQATVSALPQGSTCTVTESVPAPAVGIKHSLSWNGTTAPSASAPVTVRLPSSSENAETVGSVNANNNYTYTPGKLVFSKEIVGEPVTDGQVSGTYRFRLKCVGTDINREFTLELNRSKAANSITLDNIPVERDCAITPLTDLDETQSKTIELVSRDATFAGARTAPVGADYRFTLHEGATPELHFTTRYAYRTFPLFIRNQVNGLAAGDADVTKLAYTVYYRCEVAGRPAKEGTVTLQGPNGEATVAAVPAGASCWVWEETPGDTANTTFKGAKVTASTADDKVTTLTNDQAKQQPIYTVRAVSGSDRNQVTVINSFDPKLGTVQLHKVVNSTVTGALPDSYAFAFRCGTRNVRTGVEGQTRSVELSGRATVAANGTVTLRADDAAANDQNGFMGVPFGNTCTFTEDTPQVAGGILFSTDVQDVTRTISQATTTATVTNTFSPAGNGLTVSLRTGGRATLAPALLSYELACDNGFRQTFTLAPGATQTFTAGQVPQGTECTFTESGNSATRTSTDGREYPINTMSEYLYAADSGASTSTGNGGSIVIGRQSTMDVHHEYNFRQARVSGTKDVRFNDPNNLISQPRRDVKMARVFPVTLTCTNPDGTEGARLSTTVQQGQQPGGTNVPVGASCAVEEGETSTAVGITLEKSIAVDGALTKSGTADFTVDADGVTLLFINTYTRRTTSIELEKQAILPTDSIRTQYANAGKNLQDALYEHQFTLVCRDPETGDTAVLQRQTGAIRGEGSTSFNGVPVGADCQLVGDNFGSLALEMNDGQDNVKAFLRPAFVDWVVDREGGNAYSDQTLDNDTTTSPVFVTVDDPSKNRVRLDNHYEYETTTVRLSKDLAGLEGNLAEIPEDYSFSFALQCKAVGYQTSNVGETSFIPEKLRPRDSYVIPTQIRKADFRDNTYVSGEAKVPAGSLCTFTEQEASNVPQALTINPEEKVVRAYAPNPGAEAPSDLHFVNKVERRTTPVRVALFNSGYLAGANAAGYTAQLRCTDPAKTTTTQEVSLRDLTGSELPRTLEAPAGGQIVNLPVGAECTLDFEGSPALAPRGRLEVTDGARTPLVQFAQWGSGATIVPSGSLSDLDASEVDSAYKVYSYTFTTAADLPSTETGLTVAADIYHPRATYDVMFTKTAAGPSNGEFTFHQTCGAVPGEFQLRTGDTFTIESVPVDSDCVVDEVNDGNEDAVSVFQLSNHGELISPLAGDVDSVAFIAQPVSLATDLARSGDRWSVTASNTFPGLAVEKSIGGTPLGRFTGDAFGTTLLRHDATSMRMTYTVTNTGKFPLSKVTVTDPSLAGLNVINGSAVATIGEDGAVPASICPTKELPAGEAFTCTFNVSVPAAAEETWRYPADGDDAAVVVTATASAGGATQILRAKAAHGALKPSASISMLLPETGEQTLVLFLLLGVALFGSGAWRVSRRDDEHAEGGELVEV